MHKRPSAQRRHRLNKSRGTPCSRSRDSLRGDRWFPEATKSDRVSVSSATQEKQGPCATPCQGRDRSACRPASPELLRDWDFQSPPSCARLVQKRAGHFRAAKFPSDKEDQVPEARPWHGFLVLSALEMS